MWHWCRGFIFIGSLASSNIHVPVFFQIVSFLQQNAHPRVAEKIPTVPENVTDQVIIKRSISENGL